MLFFKQIMDEKLGKKDFRDFYEQECHICSITLQVIASLEHKDRSLFDILDTLNISKTAYKDLREGEKCDPEQVNRLCSYLGLQKPGLFKDCPNLK
ncbi:hypothetical protein [Desulfobacula sp.]|uniref:hypothetical protein n=1 Tax=Desulfobacula sp. TaxID=2593537 RepID=UPI002630258C|nr:hypothetical protein [Desulfobacula sp.]